MPYGDANNPGPRPGLPQHPEDGHVHDRLQNGRDQKDAQHFRQIVPDKVNIQQQTDGNEKHHQQNTLDRPGRRQQGRASGGIADPQTGQKSAVGRGQSQQGRYQGGAEAIGHGGDRGQFHVAVQGPREGHADPAAPGQQRNHARQQSHRREQFDVTGQGDAGASRQPVDNQQHGHDGQILGDQHANRRAAHGGAQFADVFQQFDCHGGGGKSHHEAHDNGSLHAVVEDPGQDQHGASGQQNLRPRPQHRQAQHPAKGAQGQFHADDEQQQQHAQFRQGLDWAPVREQVEPGRAKNHAGDDIADDRGLAQALED